MSDEHTLQCMEVWGGNEAVDSTVHLTGLDAWVYSKPYQAAGAGGDVYYVSSCATGRITRLLVADVSGHGVGVADLAQSLRQLMRNHVNHLQLGRFVADMNEAFVARSAISIFATAVVTTYFAPTRTLSLCNAGHPPPLLYRAATGRWRFLENDMPDATSYANFPLGIVNAVEYGQIDVSLGDGDMVLCYTDSLMEICDGHTGQQLNLPGLLEVVQEVDPTDAGTFIHRLLSAVECRCDCRLDADDATVLLFRPNADTAAPTLGRQLLAPARVGAAVARSLWKGEGRLPLPELTVSNLGGAIFTPLSRWGQPGPKNEGAEA